MGFYSRHILPRVVDFACRLEVHEAQRQKIVPRARGRVLEIGAGSGLNLPFYDATRVEHLSALEPAAEMWAMAEKRAREAAFPVEFVQASAQSIPLDDASVDTVLVTYSLCTIPAPVEAAREMRRVLRPGGALVFCEHGLAPDPGVRRWQRRLNPFWKILGGGCHLDRDIPAILRGGGFEIKDMDSTYLPGFRPASFNYWGTAT